jgi:hypothetical protein
VSFNVPTTRFRPRGIKPGLLEEGVFRGVRASGQWHGTQPQ